jgi:hypothetical protein
MNLGSLFNIRNHFYLLSLTFTIVALIKSENKKYLFLATTIKNPKTYLFTRFSLLYFLVLYLWVFYFCAPLSLVLLTFSQLLNFSSLLPSSLYETITNALDDGLSSVNSLDHYMLTVTVKCWWSG